MKTICLNLFLCAVLIGGSMAQNGSVDGSNRQDQTQLAHDPDNVAVLTARAQKLQQEGKWREAMPVLERLVTREPHSAAALYQLGSMKSWAGERKQALDLLRGACEISNRNAEYCGAYAEVLSWRREDRAKAIAVLQQLLAANPENASSRLHLAQVLSWDSATRARALQLYQEGLQLDPGNIELLIGSAEVLSWNSATRSQAMAGYDEALQLKPDDARALTGKAQLLAWQGKSTEALRLYERVLDKDPHNPSALRGKAEILNWKGRYSEAESLAGAAANAAPGDDRARLELARADIGLHKYAAARDAIAAVDGQGPGFSDTRQEIHRGLGTWAELGYRDRREQRLSYDRVAVALSTPLAPGHRITFSYQPTLFDAGVQGFNTNYFSATIDSDATEKFSSHLQFGSETFNNAPVNFDGGMQLNYKPVSSTVLKLAFVREPLEESLLSRRGLDLSSVNAFQGQVHSNLGSLGLSYYNDRRKYDLSLDYTDGVYTGENVDLNRRYSVDGQIGRGFHGDRPYVRLAYGVSYTRFDHDADIQGGVIVPGVTGGYFSPRRFLLNQGVLNISHRFTNNLILDAAGTAGTQNVETSTTSFRNAQFASSASVHLFWRATPMNEFSFGYDYLNVFNAFNRRLYSFKWRHYF